MTRRIWSYLLVLGLLAAACGSAKPVTQPLPAPRWVPQTVDFLSDAGRSPSIAVDADGNPHLAYLGLEQELKAGQIAQARPLTLPFLPAVLTSDLVDGIWSHGAVAQSKSANDADKLPLKPTDLVSVAIDDQGGSHVVWTENGDLFYSSATGSEFGEPQKIISGNPRGISIAVDSSGTPWVSFFRDKALRVATLEGKKWAIEEADDFTGHQEAPARTSIQAGPDGPVVAYTDTSSNSTLARRVGGNWTREPIDPDNAGYGISLDLDADGNPHVAYYTDTGEVRHAHSVAGTPWEVSTLGQAGSKPDPGWSASIGLDQRGVHWIAWYDDKSDRVRLSTNKSGDFAEIPVTGTDRGEFPQVAVPEDGADVFVAWYDPLNADLLMGTYGVNGPPGIALAGVSPSASGGPTSAPPPATCKPDGTDITIVAPPGASASGFDETCLAAPAGEPFTITFENNDPSMVHNVDVYTEQGGDHLFGATSSEFTTGVDSVTYKVPVQDPGTYFYQCDVHPTAMIGTFIIK